MLKGIDATQSRPEDDGWWETTTGAEFGAEKLAEIEALLRRYLRGESTIFPTREGLTATSVWVSDQSGMKTYPLREPVSEPGQFTVELHEDQTATLHRVKLVKS